MAKKLNVRVRENSTDVLYGKLLIVLRLFMVKLERSSCYND